MTNPRCFAVFVLLNFVQLNDWRTLEMRDGVLNAFTYTAVFGHESTYYANKSSIRSEYSAITNVTKAFLCRYLQPG